MTKPYGIVNKKNITKLHGQDTRLSRYYIKAVNDDSFEWNPNVLPIKRKLSSREDARTYKRSLKNANNWSIVDLRYGEVVR